MTARALVVTHSAGEGPGTLADWLPAAGLELEVVAPWEGQQLPADLQGYDALVVMGGPQQAYDDSSAPWLPATKELLREAVDRQVPTLPTPSLAECVTTSARAVLITGPGGSGRARTA